jgi:hypothetical protein
MIKNIELHILFEKALFSKKIFKISDKVDLFLATLQ